MPVGSSRRGNLKHAEAITQALGLETDAAESILQREPMLLSVAPTQLTTHLQGLCSSLSASKERIGAMATKHPELLLLPPNALRKRAANLAKQMRIADEAALQCVRKAPAILTQSMAELKERLEQTAAVLAVDMPTLAKAARKQPVLFIMPTSTVQAHVQVLATELELDYAAACRVLLTCPSTLTTSAQSIAAKRQHLQQHWHLPAATASRCIQRCPTILELSTATIQHNAEQLHTIPLSKSQLTHLATTEPGYISQAAATTKERLQRLQQLLQLTPKQALQLVMRRPALLLKNANSLSNAHRALSIWDFSASFKQQLLLEHPLLLRLAGQEVSGRCTWLRLLMMRSAYVHATLRELPPKLLGVLILHLPSVWARLEYIVEGGLEQEGGLRLMEALQCSMSRWVPAWLWHWPVCGAAWFSGAMHAQLLWPCCILALM